MGLNINSKYWKNLNDNNSSFLCKICSVMVLLMLEELDQIKEIQKEAKKIIEEAYIEAKKIRESKSKEVSTANEDAFLENIAKAEKNAEKLQQTCKIDVEDEMKKILKTAEQESKIVESKAQNNYEKAVNHVIKMIIEEGDQK